MKILVTGHQGRIGSVLVPVLRAQFAEQNEVRGFDRKSGAELNEPGHLFGAFRAFEPEVVIHLAAQTSVQLSLVEPTKDVEDNVLGTARVLDYAQQFGARVILAGSAGTIHDVQSPYGLSKKVANDYAKLYNKLYEMEVITLGLANVYGPGITGGVIHEFIMAERQSRPGTQNPPGCKITGDGLQTRDFIYIDDVVQAFCEAVGGKGDHGFGQTGWKPGYYEVATGRLESVFGVFRLLTYEWGYTPKLVYQEALPGEVKGSPPLNCDLPWTPLALEEGLKRSVNA